MDVEDEITLLGDEDLVAQLERLKTMGVHVREMPHSVKGNRALMLVDTNGVLLLACLLRMEVVDQVQEMLTFYETAIISPDATRH